MRTVSREINFNKLLKKVDDPNTLVFEFFSHYKKLKPSFSIQYLCNKSGISSKGLLSDIMKQRRKLPLKYAAPLAKALGLNYKQSRLFVLLVEKQRNKSIKEEASLEKKIITARKNLDVITGSIKSGDFDPLIFSQVFCCLGVKKINKTVESISKFLNISQNNVRKSLEALIKQGFVEKMLDKYFIKEDESVRFTEGDAMAFHKKMIRTSVENSIAKLDKGFEKSNETYFDSSVISVSKKKYLKILPKIKNIFDELQTELETSDADELIHFNIMVYPQSNT